MSNKENFSIDTEDLKNETKDTVNKVKDTIKNVDFKKDTAETKGFIKEMISDPFEKIKNIASGNENILKNATIIMIIYIAANVVSTIISLMKHGKYSSLGENTLTLLASVLNPLFYIAVPAVIILLLNRKNKKSLITVICTLVAASIPVVINSIIDVIEVLVSGITIISSPISTALSSIALILTYFGMKDIFEEEENKVFIRKFAVVKIAAAFILLVLSRIGIY